MLVDPVLVSPFAKYLVTNFTYLKPGLTFFSNCQDGKADVVANDAGDRVTPAIVSFSSEEIVRNNPYVQLSEIFLNVNILILSIHLPQAVGLPAKQGLFRNMSTTAVKCKELFFYNTNVEESDHLQSLSSCPIVVKNGKLFYEIEVDEKKKHISPQEILVHIYRKLYGKFTFYNC